MDIATFIQTTLVQIARGIEGANDELKGSSAIVNPRGIRPSPQEDTKFYGYLDEKNPEKFLRVVQEIEFDVAVFVSEGTETKGGIGIMVGTIGLGSHGKSDKGSSSESRIRFKVPMTLPVAK